ncbi:MAG TPA: DinB family protein [Saprospiraceae bacterium]|nr:DinB family protein [Saprospiraceae bacterium]
MIDEVIYKVRRSITTAFVQVDSWFDVPADLKNYRPPTGGWTIAEILEHIALTNFFLLKLIDKGADKALRNVQNLNLEEELTNYQFHVDALDEIGITKSFSWIRPEHMEPTGEKSLEEVRAELLTQEQRCLDHLDNLQGGEGVLYRTTMTVNDLGKIDVYQYIYFVAMHAQRHVQQMVKNRSAFEEQKILSQ